MPRYFFNVRDGAELSQDCEGQELPSLDAARLEAANSARELIGEQILHGGALEGRSIEIADDGGAVLAVIDPCEVIFREGHFQSFSDDVTKSAPVARLIASKRPAE